MNFKTFLSHGEEIGTSLSLDHAFLFFGQREFTRASFAKHFPNLRFALLKQVHGAAVLPADPTCEPQADGHITDHSRVALVAQTADCVPILLAGPTQVAALHSGWRGVAARIVDASKARFSQPPTLAAVGPHIRRASFEVGLDVVEQLLEATPKTLARDKVVFSHADPQKRFVDLNAIVQAQLLETFPGIRIIDTGENTVTDTKFHSFRRDKTQAERQYSFVVLNPPKFAEM